MFNRHLLKVIIGFCGMIVFGLILLVFIDSFKTKDDPTLQVTENKKMPTILPPIDKTKTPIKKTH